MTERTTSECLGSRNTVVYLGGSSPDKSIGLTDSEISEKMHRPARHWRQNEIKLELKPPPSKPIKDCWNFVDLERRQVMLQNTEWSNAGVSQK